MIAIMHQDCCCCCCYYYYYYFSGYYDGPVAATLSIVASWSLPIISY